MTTKFKQICDALAGQPLPLKAFYGIYAALYKIESHWPELVSPKINSLIRRGLLKCVDSEKKLYVWVGDKLQ